MRFTLEKEKKADKRVHGKLEKTLRVRTSRRSFLKGLMLGAGAAVVMPAKTAKSFSWDEFFQNHYKELSPADKKRIFARIEKETKEKYGVNVNISDPQPMDGVEFVYCLNLSKCVGVRACVYACAKENNLSRDPQIQYIKVLEIPKGSLNPEQGNMYYNHKEVPQKDKIYMPVQCNQCRNPPCVKACPVEATWSEKDGIVVVDYNWCIGCRYCEAACPYEARHFNFATPSIPASEINPEQGYLSNRIRPRGVMEKCTYCLQRTRRGKYPACLEVCPTGARKFGNILDPDSEVSRIIREKQVFVLKEELGTQPRFYYFFD